MSEPKKLNEYEQIMIEALVQDELNNRLAPLTEHLQEIVDYLRQPNDDKKPWLINSWAHAGADMLSELIALINANPYVNIGQFPE